MKRPSLPHWFSWAQDHALVTKFPLLYSQRHRLETSLRYGFQVQPGWYDLVLRTSEAIDRIIAEMPVSEQPHFFATQVRTKYTSLLIEMSETTPMMERIIAHAAEVSTRLCESCGAHVPPQASPNALYPPGLVYPPHGNDREWRTRVCTDHFNLYSRGY